MVKRWAGASWLREDDNGNTVMWEDHEAAIAKVERERDEALDMLDDGARNYLLEKWAD